MSSAPTFGMGYMEVDPATSPAYPPNQSEQDILATLPAEFAASWDRLKYQLPVDWQNNVAVIAAIHAIAADYAPNAPAVNP